MLSAKPKYYLFSCLFVLVYRLYKFPQDSFCRNYGKIRPFFCYKTRLGSYIQNDRPKTDTVSWITVLYIVKQVRTDLLRPWF